MFPVPFLGLNVFTSEAGESEGVGDMEARARSGLPGRGPGQPLTRSCSRRGQMRPLPDRHTREGLLLYRCTPCLSHGPRTALDGACEARARRQRDVGPSGRPQSGWPPHKGSNMGTPGLGRAKRGPPWLGPLPRRWRGPAEGRGRSPLWQGPPCAGSASVMGPPACGALTPGTPRLVAQPSWGGCRDQSHLLGLSGQNRKAG